MALSAAVALATLLTVIVVFVPFVLTEIWFAAAPAVTLRTPALLIVVPLISIPVPAVYVVSVNLASAGTLVPIMNPLSLITLPVVPLNVTTCASTELAGPVTAPSIFD